MKTNGIKFHDGRVRCGNCSKLPLNPNALARVSPLFDAIAEGQCDVCRQNSAAPATDNTGDQHE